MSIAKRCLILVLVLLLFPGFLVPRVSAFEFPKKLSKPGISYFDDTGWLKDEDGLEYGMQQFERDTGIKPFLLVTNQKLPHNTKKFLKTAYEKFCKDDDRLLIVFQKESLFSRHYELHFYADGKAEEEFTKVDEQRFTRYFRRENTFGTDLGTAFGTVFSDTASEMELLEPGMVFVAIVAVLLVCLFGMDSDLLPEDTKEKVQA